MTRSYVRHSDPASVVYRPLLRFIWDMTHRFIILCHSHVRHDSSLIHETAPCLCGPSLYYSMCDMTHSFVRHDAFIYETWLIHTRMPPIASLCYIKHDPTLIVLCETWPNAALFYVRHDSMIDCTTLDMTQRFIVLCETWPSTSLYYVSHDPPLQFRHDPTLLSFIVQRFIIFHSSPIASFYVRHDSSLHCSMSDMTHHFCSSWCLTDMTHTFVRHDAFIYETWLIHTWDMTHFEPALCFCRPSLHNSIWDMTH